MPCENNKMFFPTDVKPTGWLLCQWFSPLFRSRFSIDPTSDQDMIFRINPETGAITLGKTLDRETAGWHNITVRAVEAGKPPFHCGQCSLWRKQVNRFSMTTCSIVCWRSRRGNILWRKNRRKKNNIILVILWEQLVPGLTSSENYGIFFFDKTWGNCSLFTLHHSVQTTKNHNSFFFVFK